MAKEPNKKPSRAPDPSALELRLEAIRAAHQARNSRPRDYGDVLDVEIPDLNFDELDER